MEIDQGGPIRDLYSKGAFEFTAFGCDYLKFFFDILQGHARFSGKLQKGGLPLGQCLAGHSVRWSTTNR